VMELYISDHPLDCLTCSANGDCELQDMAGAVGLREVRYGFEGENHLDEVKDESNPYFTFDPSKCISCSRCVRACEETQGTFALTIENRGFASTVARLCRFRMRQLRCLRTSLPDRHVDRKNHHRSGPARAF
jgi:formate dehydrogenase major subunit